MTNEELMELTMKELKAKAVDGGMPQETVDLFTTKAQVVGVITSQTEKVKLVDQTKSGDETTKEKKSSDSAWLSKRDTMGKHLEAQPKVGMSIPLQAGEKVGVVESRVVNGIREFKVISGGYKEKNINGYKWIMPKGTMTMVPQQVYELVSNEINALAMLGSKNTIDRIDPLTGKPVRSVLS